MLLRVGLTGGLASGKSAVAEELRRLGCHVIEADKLGHEALEGEAFESVVRTFGDGILTGGRIDRRKLAAIVFEDPVKLDLLNAIVHPVVRRLTAAKMSGIASGIAIYEAAILVEAGGFEDFDRLIVVSCPEDMQIARAMAREPGVDREQVLARMRRQAPLAGKLKHADYAIDTSGTLEHTLEQTRKVYQSLLLDLNSGEL